ncbi:hypothetical protein [Streptomyces sp. AcE210]|uniref:hypothetical protein n=1 Tax=Streptomyces sp. AcE210 TaxID=2292703 RepID=UPI000E308A10|nr:hypothetical protein [Streptomyces sp. AcE210]RFC78076.1 hypothetical protein DXZ75_09920 [Streptomyces sp. AcE210]
MVDVLAVAGELASPDGQEEVPGSHIRPVQSMGAGQAGRVADGPHADPVALENVFEGYRRPGGFRPR